MKKLAGVVLGLVFSHIALADYKDDILDLCSIAKKGNFSQIQAKGHLQADGSVKLATLGGKGEVSFSKGEWSGVQQVLKEHQVTDNVTARDCVIKLMPYFKSKVAATPAPKVVNKPQKKAVKKVQSKPAATDKTAPKSNEPKPDAEVNVETHGDTSPAINGNGATVNYN